MQWQVMQWSATHAANSVCTLPRLRGRGGEGAPCTVYLCVCPLPNPPPQAGEGTHRIGEGVQKQDW
jgi:hypothetical protein